MARNCERDRVPGYATVYLEQAPACPCPDARLHNVQQATAWPDTRVRNVQQATAWPDTRVHSGE